MSAPLGTPPWGAVSWGSCGDAESAPLPCSRPRCSWRFFGCLRYCRWLPAFSCYPELCCPWLLEALHPSPLRPRAPATFRDQSLQPLSLVPTRKSPRRSQGGDLGRTRLGVGEGCRPWAARPCALNLISLHPQGSGREAPGSLRQPHPADHIHVSCQSEP